MNPEQLRERAARLVWFVYGDDLTVEGALDPRNDAHWNAWKGDPDAKSAWDTADAILALGALVERPEVGAEKVVQMLSIVSSALHNAATELHYFGSPQAEGYEDQAIEAFRFLAVLDRLNSSATVGK